MNAPAWRDDVLRQLDAAAEQLFPGPPNENYPGVAVRLDGFAGETEWLLVFQVLAYGRPTAQFSEDVHLFGSDVPTPGFLAVREVVEPLPGTDFWSDDEEERFLLDLRGFAVLIDGAPREFSFTEAQIEQTGVRSADVEPELTFIRVLAAFHADELFRTPERLLAELDRPGLKHLFRLDGWRQPESMDDEKPSDLACFRAIADSIAARQPVGLDSCAETANTHWSHWTEVE